MDMIGFGVAGLLMVVVRFAFTVAAVLVALFIWDRWKGPRR